MVASRYYFTGGLLKCESVESATEHMCLGLVLHDLAIASEVAVCSCYVNVIYSSLRSLFSRSLARVATRCFKLCSPLCSASSMDLFKRLFDYRRTVKFNVRAVQDWGSSVSMEALLCDELELVGALDKVPPVQLALDEEAPTPTRKAAPKGDDNREPNRELWAHASLVSCHSCES